MRVAQARVWVFERRLPRSRAITRLLTQREIEASWKYLYRIYKILRIYLMAARILFRAPKRISSSRAMQSRM